MNIVIITLAILAVISGAIFFFKKKDSSVKPSQPSTPETTPPLDY